METIKTGLIYRTAQIRGVEDRTVNVAFSSEEPVERSFGTEILDHALGCVDLRFISGGTAPLLVDHNLADSSDPTVGRSHGGIPTHAPDGCGPHRWRRQYYRG